MTSLSNLWGDIKSKSYLKGFAILLEKMDEEKIVDYLEQYGEKVFKRGKDDFVDLAYYKLLEVVSAINRRRKK